jgi:hypothetical protein
MSSYWWKYDYMLSLNSPNGGWSNMGYPIIEFNESYFVLTKPPGTGGYVGVESVCEQMIYEIGDPSSYVLPDVILDMRNVRVENINGEIRVSGAKGRAPTPYLKVSGVFVSGYKVTAELFIGGIDARKKAIGVGEAIVTRVGRILGDFGLSDFTEVNIEALGSEHTYGSNSLLDKSREVVLRLTVLHNNPQALKLFLLEIAPSATCMAPGIIGVSGGRPRPSANMTHFSSLVKKNFIQAVVTVGKKSSLTISFIDNSRELCKPSPINGVSLIRQQFGIEEKLVSIPLVKVCYARSGDKGDCANIGVICRNSKFYGWLLETLTAEKVADYMSHLCKGKVSRYEMPGIYALNFVLTKSLGGGGLSSLQVDRQGKSFAQMLLSMNVSVPNSWPLEYERKISKFENKARI